MKFLVDKNGDFHRVDDEIVRCKKCKNGVRLDASNYFVCNRPFASNRETHIAEWFCADRERKESK